ncbi:GyrI-like domain-containing protein [Tersicoccus sp. MR15.9]|uniref:GyrI-like domain-containing protein n=1 Tax=Tersicoccus mangrovi TaxID=3121635 RepID=UPI002FE67D57
MALRGLGFGLDQIGAMVREDVTAEGLRSLLSTRRDEITLEHHRALRQLADFELRLLMIEKEHAMNDVDVVIKSLPAVRIACRTAVADSQPEIGGIVGPMFAEVAGAVARAGGIPRTPVAEYTADDDGRIHIVAGFAFDGDARSLIGGPIDGVEVRELPAVDEAACVVHLGSMETIGVSWQTLHQQLPARGVQPSGPGRELYVRAEPVDDQSQWVTELQQPVTAGS